MAVVSAEIRQQAEALVLPLFAGLIEGMLEGYLLAEGRTPSTLAFVERMRENQVLEDRKRVDVVAQILQRNADAAAAAAAAPAERFTYAATLRPITDAFLFEARGLYDPKYPYFDEIPARYGERAQRHGIVSVNQRLPLDFQRHMDLRLITADGPPSIQREVTDFIDRQTQEVVGAYVRAFPDEKDLNLFANDFTRQIQDAVREQYGATDAVELVPEAVQRAIESVVAAPAAPARPAEQVKPLLPKPILQALLRSGHEIVPSGPQQAGFRMLLMEKIGKPVPASKAGVTAVTKALAEYLDVDTNRTGYGAVDEMRAKLKAMLSAHESLTAAPASVEEAPPAEPVEQPHQPDPEPAMGAYGEYLATLPDKQRQKARAVLDSPYMMRESSKDEPIKGARHAIVEQLLDRQRSMPYRPLEPGKSIGDKSGPLLLNFYGFFKVKPEEHAYALWLYDRLIAAEKAAKNGVDRRVAEPLNYGAIIEGEANRIFALHTQVALD